LEAVSPYLVFRSYSQDILSKLLLVVTNLAFPQSHSRFHHYGLSSVPTVWILVWPCLASNMGSTQASQSTQVVLAHLCTFMISFSYFRHSLGLSLFTLGASGFYVTCSAGINGSTGGCLPRPAPIVLTLFFLSCFVWCFDMPPH